MTITLFKLTIGSIGFVLKASSLDNVNIINQKQTVVQYLVI